jgi:hypothetical protein
MISARVAGQAIVDDLGITGLQAAPEGNTGIPTVSTVTTLPPIGCHRVHPPSELFNSWIS